MMYYFKHINPCEYEQLAAFFEWFTLGTECRCCIGVRIVLAFIIGYLLG